MPFFGLIRLKTMIDLDKIKDVSMLGIRRASIFMGFGINCVDNRSNNDFHLQKYSPFNFIPNNLNDSIKDEYKQEFKYWIVSNGFRELTESFEIYLKSIFDLCNKLKPCDKKILKSFEQNGINFRLECLKKYYSITPNFSEGFKTINDARNCLTHRKGIISNKDLNENESMVIKWTGYDMKIENPSGKNYTIDYPITNEIIWDKDGKLLIIPTSRSKCLKINEIIKFNPKELLEICYYFFNETNVLHNSTINYLKDNGIMINYK